MERSDEAYYAWMQSATRFDYFVAGVSLAATGYLAAELEPVPLALNAGGLEVTAVLLLLASSVAALKRIEATVIVTAGLHRRLRAGELLHPSVRIGPDHPVAQNEVEIDEWSTRAQFWYKWRDGLLIGGLGAYVAAQIWAAYG